MQTDLYYTRSPNTQIPLVNLFFTVTLPHLQVFSLILIASVYINSLHSCCIPSLIIISFKYNTEITTGSFTVSLSTPNTPPYTLHINNYRSPQPIHPYLPISFTQSYTFPQIFRLLQLFPYTWLSSSQASNSLYKSLQCRPYTSPQITTGNGNPSRRAQHQTWK